MWDHPTGCTCPQCRTKCHPTTSSAGDSTQTDFIEWSQSFVAGVAAGKQQILEDLLVWIGTQKDKRRSKGDPNESRGL